MKTEEKMTTVPERIAALRSKMKENKTDVYLVPTEDFHGSEYVGEFFKCRKFITGFTGSAGTALIGADFSMLWTDGRYFLQAQQQLEGTGIYLQRMREEGVPTIEEYLEMYMGEGQVLGFDGRTITDREGQKLSKLLEKKGASVNAQLDLVGDIWEERPPMSAEKVWVLGDEYAGESAKDKLLRIRKAMKEEGADYLLLTSLDDIAWLLNLRGNDVECNPVFMSYLLLGQKTALLYAQEEAFGEDERLALKNIDVALAPYDRIYTDIRKIEDGASVWADPDKVNFSLTQLIPKSVSVIRKANPTLIAKAVKNAVEQEHIRQAHIIDAVAVTKFIYWLKTNVGKEHITELSAGDKLEEFRKMGRDYLGPSFTPIVGYADHAAIIHYSPTKESDVPVEARGMLLVDSGGQYKTGTTDITRTIVLGPVTQEEKEFFTRVLRGTLNLGDARFLKGCCGINLDYLAREPLWEIGEDYNHGTGHGVGFVLNVHEGPNSFHYRAYPGRKAETVMEPGMVTSDEPGYYLPGKFGIRHENLLLCVEGEKRPCGQFLKFEHLTLVPFDLDGILPEMMSQKERNRLNEYHRRVYETISGLLDDDERSWLKEATRPI